MKNHKEEQAARKEILKQIASQIKDKKKELKVAYSELKDIGHKYGVPLSIQYVKYDQGIMYDARHAYLEGLRKCSWLQYDIHMLSVKFRGLHIIYCLNNGTPMEKIEPKRDENKYKYEMCNYHEDIDKAIECQKMYKRFLTLQTIAV